MEAFTKTDEYWMRRALAFARRALGNTQPNPLVGAVVLDSDGHCVGTGTHEKVGSGHAEALALQRAGSKAKGGTLYVTLEPCTHQGRTPPCTDQILKSEIGRVVMASLDPNPHVQGGGLALLRQSGVQVESGCLEAQALQLNQPYFHFVAHNRPLVTAKVAVSSDGRMGTGGGRVRISGSACLSTTMKLRAEAGAILVGVATVLADDPLLTVRGKGSHRKPLRGIIDPSLRTPPDSQILEESNGPVTLFCRESALETPQAKLLASKGAILHALPEIPSGLDLDKLFNYFGELGITSTLVEGGSKLLSSLATSHLIDRWVIYLSPKVLESTPGALKTTPDPGWMFDRPPLANGENEARFGPFRLKIRSVIRRGDDQQILAWPI